MNTKFFVPYKTAKALKEKGYPQTWANYYYQILDNEAILLVYSEIANCVLVGGKESPNFKKLSKTYTAAPTYHEVLDWFESKGIRIFAHYYLDVRNWMFIIENFKRLQGNVGWFDTREQALNAGILKALEMK